MPERKHLDAPQNRFKPCPSACVLLVALLLCCSGPAAAAPAGEDFISLPPEFASRVPARLVFSQEELIQCWQEASARRCVLRGPIVLDPSSWQQAFASTGGSATVSFTGDPQQADNRFTLTSELCAPGSPCLSGGSHVLHTLNFNQIPYAMRVVSGATLVFTNIQLFNLAPASAYTYSSNSPWRSTGQGTTTWPSIGLAVNATAALVNASILYYNPSDTDNCTAYTQKRIFAYRQVWGEGNITEVNATANLIVGPQYIDVIIRNGSSNAILGNATVYYRNVTFICMEDDTPASPSGPDPATLAVAIAVPVGVCLLAAGLLALWCWRRRRRRRQQQQQLLQQQPPLLAASAKQPLPPTTAEDLEFGQGGMTDAQPDRQQDQVKLSREPTNDSFSSAGKVAPWVQQLQAQLLLRLRPAQDYGRSSGATVAAATDAASGGAGTRQNSQALQGSGGTLQWNDSAGVASGLQGSGGTFDLSTCSTGLQSYDTGPSGRSMDDRISSAAAVLKARSDVAVLRDLKIGPLLGRGSYGRVYRGHWKATPVAVKIIEHHAAGARSSGGKTVSAGRETLLATSVSHPNVVTTYHISTMSMSQRSALASSWLEGGAGGPSSSQQPVQEEPEEAGDDAASSGGSAISSDLDEEPPDHLTTWVVMEFCEKGSLERAVRLGKFKRGDDQQMVGIYKALLDTASGLDYLHSIGVVHGDLKTANVLLKGSTRDARGVTCKITDFGLSRVLDMNASHISTGTYGTIVYMPKELLLSGRMTQATDIYSFGLVMWELFTSEPVMSEGLSIGQMFYMIAYQDWRPEVPANCPPGYAELMTACWHEDPEQRPTAQQLLRRLQKLYVQARQQYLAGREGGAAASTSRAARSAAQDAAGQSPRAAAAPATNTPPASDSSKPRVSTGPGAAAAAAASGATVAAAGTSSGAMQQPQQWQLQRGPSSQAPVVRHASSRLASSVEEGSSIDFTAPAAAGRRSIGSGEQVDPEEYQPYVQAVLRRSTSVSSPRQGPPMPLTSLAPRGVEGGGMLELVQLQQGSVAQQQQQLQSFAVSVPLMLPVGSPGGTVSGTGMAFDAPSFPQEYGSPGQDAAAGEEDELFDEDGLASESLLRQLTNPTNTAQADYEDTYSGYLHPPGPDEGALYNQSMQQTVDQYRAHLQLLQQRSQQQ